MRTRLGLLRRLEIVFETKETLFSIVITILYYIFPLHVQNNSTLSVGCAITPHFCDQTSLQFDMYNNKPNRNCQAESYSSLNGKKPPSIHFDIGALK